MNITIKINNFRRSIVFYDKMSKINFFLYTLTCLLRIRFLFPTVLSANEKMLYDTSLYIVNLIYIYNFDLYMYIYIYIDQNYSDFYLDGCTYLQ